jgi:hypothetical protein
MRVLTALDNTPSPQMLFALRGNERSLQYTLPLERLAGPNVAVSIERRGPCCQPKRVKGRPLMPHPQEEKVLYSVRPNQRYDGRNSCFDHRTRESRTLAARLWGLLGSRLRPAAGCLDLRSYTARVRRRLHRSAPGALAHHRRAATFATRAARRNARSNQQQYDDQYHSATHYDVLLL